MTIKPKQFGLAGGVLWSSAVFLVAVAGIVMPGYGTAFINLISSIYPYYSATWLGAFLGLVYGFIDGFIGCWLFAWLYNKFK